MNWIERRREKKRVKRERTGDSPERQAEHHTPPGGAVDMMLKLGIAFIEVRRQGASRRTVGVGLD
jgi:hypothetical protein